MPKTPNIEEALKEFNPWWKRKYTAKYKPRELYPEIQDYMQDPQILALTGLRRTGKTTLMRKIVQDAIEKGDMNAKSILYFSFDEFQEVSIREILQQYQEIFNQSLEEEKTLLLLDEVQKLKNWENQVKTFYDNYKGKMKIVVSGSESLFIRRGIKETLAGRMYEFRVKPLTFNEYLGFKGEKEKLRPVKLYKRELRNHFQDYIKTLGFPELVGVTKKKKIRKYVDESIVEKVIYRDLANLVKSRDIEKLEAILRILMRDPGQIIKTQDLAKDLDLSRTTLSNYLSYLEKSFLIKKLYNYSKSQRKTERKLRKFYPTVLSSSLLFKEDTHNKSRVFEWLLANHLDAEFFWRDPYKNEVDFILTSEENVVPVEAKYGKIETKPLEKFMDKHDLQEGWILTKEREDEIEKEGKTIHVVPAYEYLIR